MIAILLINITYSLLHYIMKLCEIKHLLSDAEAQTIINESISDELKDMVKTNVTVPLTNFRKQTIATFSKKLKAWALTMLHDLQKGADFDDSKHYVQTLDKIINNPEGIASQLLANVMSAYSAKPTKEVAVAKQKEVEKIEMANLDSVLDSIKF